MIKKRAAITGIGAYVPDSILDNFELSKMVETSNEWIIQRVGIKERRILKARNKATSYMAVKAIKDLLQKTNTAPEEVDFVVCATITPDMLFPATANIICNQAGLKNAFSYDLGAACSGFIFALETGRRFIESGGYKKVIVVGADKMSAVTNYADRTTCALFGDGAGAVLLEPAENGYGIMDAILGVDGSGVKNLHMPAGGSLLPPNHDTIESGLHYLYQEGQAVFKFAVVKMADVSVEIMKRNGLNHNDIKYLVPHQANMRIIEATAKRMGIKREQVMITIEKYGNTTAATIPLCLWEYEKQLKPGDNLILTSFGAGFTWGSIYVKWALGS